MRRLREMASEDLQEEIALGGAATRLRARGYSWQETAAALGVIYWPRVKQATVRYLVWLEGQSGAAGTGDRAEGPPSRIPRKQRSR